MKPACRPNFKEFVCTLCRGGMLKLKSKKFSGRRSTYYLKKDKGLSIVTCNYCKKSSSNDELLIVFTNLIEVF